MTLRKKSREIAALNDMARETFFWCRLILSQGIMSLGEHDRTEILDRVRNFNEFTKDNDPYGEHDFGMVEYQGSKYFWKFDYFDRKMLFGSPQASDPSQTTRVLTVFLSDEY